MTLTKEELAYLGKHRMVRLTFDGHNDLYRHPLYGAHTIKDCIEKDRLYAALPKPQRVRCPESQVSDELMRRHEHCVDTYGCGLF